MAVAAWGANEVLIQWLPGQSLALQVIRLSLSIGAAPEADVRIGGPGIENKHAELRPSFSGFTLVDLDSRNGTRVNGTIVQIRRLRSLSYPVLRH